MESINTIISDIRKGVNIDLYVTIFLSLVLAIVNVVFGVFRIRIDFDLTPLNVSTLFFVTIVLLNNLHLHVHMRTADCYGKLLMNFNEFISLQRFVAKELLLGPGSYVHFIDSLHFHNDDKKSVTELYLKLNNKCL